MIASFLHQNKVYRVRELMKKLSAVSIIAVNGRLLSSKHYNTLL